MYERAVGEDADVVLSAQSMLVDDDTTLVTPFDVDVIMSEYL